MSLLGPISTLARWRDAALDVDFLSGQLPVGMTVSRSGPALYWDASGRLRQAAENEPQFEYDANGRPLGLLLETASNNMTTYSNDPMNGGWVASFAQKTGGMEAPDGTPTAVRVDPVDGSMGGLYKAFTLSQLTEAIALSVYIKPIPGQSGTLAFTLRNDTKGVTVSPYGYFNVATMEVSAGAEFWRVQRCPRGWYRMIGIFPTAGYSAGDAMRFYWGSTGTSARPSFVVWGMQVEPRAVATSLIPTDATAGIARPLSMASMPTSLFYRPDVGGGLLVEAVPIGPPHITPDLGYLFVMHDGSNNNRVAGYVRRDNSVYRVQPVVAANGTVTVSEISGAFPGLYNGRSLKVGINFGSSGASSAVNGAVTSSTSAPSLPISPSVLELRKTGQAGFYYRTLRYYDRAVDIATLTAV